MESNSESDILKSYLQQIQNQIRSLQSKVDDVDAQLRDCENAWNAPSRSSYREITSNSSSSITLMRYTVHLLADKGPISERDLRHLAIAYCKDNGIKITNRGSVISSGGVARSATVDIASILGVLNALGIVEEILPGSSRYPKESKDPPKMSNMFSSIDGPSSSSNASQTQTNTSSTDTASTAIINPCTTTSNASADSATASSTASSTALECASDPPRAITPSIPITIPAEAMVTPTAGAPEEAPAVPSKPVTTDATPMDISPTSLSVDALPEASGCETTENGPPARSLSVTTASAVSAPARPTSTPSAITSSLSSSNLAMHPFLSYIVEYWATAITRKKDGASTPTSQCTLPDTPTSLPDTPKPSKRPRLWQLAPNFTPFPISAWGAACHAAQSAAHEEESLLRRILGSCSKSLPTPSVSELLVQPPVMDGTSNFTAAMIMDRAGGRKYKRAEKIVKKKKHSGLGDVTYIRHAVPPLVVEELSPTITTAPIDWSDVSKEFVVYHPPENDAPPLPRSASAESVASAKVLNMAATPKNLNGAVGTWVTVAEDKEEIWRETPERRRSISEGKLNGDSNGRHREFRRISFADVIAPSFRPVQSTAPEDESSGEEDLSDEAFAARHDIVLSKMRERWSKLLNKDDEATNEQHGRRGHWKKHHGGRLSKKRRSETPSVQTPTSTPMSHQPSNTFEIE